MPISRQKKKVKRKSALLVILIAHSPSQQTEHQIKLPSCILAMTTVPREQGSGTVACSRAPRPRGTVTRKLYRSSLKFALVTQVILVPANSLWSLNPPSLHGEIMTWPILEQNYVFCLVSNLICKEMALSSKLPKWDCKTNSEVPFHPILS